MWDVTPVAFNGISALEAKMTGGSGVWAGLTLGMFTYGPGRVPPPPNLGIPQSLIAGAFPPGMGLVNPMRQTKRLYFGKVTDEMTEAGLKAEFTKLMMEKKFAAALPGDVVASITLNKEKGFGYVEVGRRRDRADRSSEPRTRRLWRWSWTGCSTWTRSCASRGQKTISGSTLRWASYLVWATRTSRSETTSCLSEASRLISATSK